VWQHAAAFGEITSLFIMRLCGSMLQHFEDVLLLGTQPFAQQ
jgi:hypothetical protein